MTQTEALRLALEALKEDRAWLETDAPTEVWEKNNEAITVIKAALEAKDEPVAWMYDWTTSEGEFIQNWTTSEAETLRDTEPTIITNVRPLYTTPPQRTWVGLTDEEVTWLCNTAKSHEQTWGMFVRAIEAKLKEKNT